MEYEEEKSQTDIDWERRTLCVDESCIGVIGPDGRCKECGIPYKNEHKQDIPPTHDGDESPYEKDHTEDESPYEKDHTEDESPYEKDHTEDEEDESPSDIDWENRTLCIDESCIGVVGSDGRCKECGKPFSPNIS